MLLMIMDWRNLYECAFLGSEIKTDSKDDNPFRYCGEYYDKETEEIYLRARYYQPKAGRFLTRDTYTGEDDEPESLHLYTYCENDGVNMVDPTGHYKVNEAIKNEIKGMTKYDSEYRIFDSLYKFKYLKNIIKKRVVKTWCKKKNKTFVGVSDYELLARTLYFESSPNNKSAKARRNEIITFYKVIKARVEKKTFGGDTMRKVLTAPG